MQIICNVTGSERKRLADVLGAHLLMEPIYKKAPTFAYVVSDYTIDKNGTIICPESASVEDMARIVAKLTEEGFDPEIEGIESVEDDDPVSEDENAEDAAPAEIPAETPDVAPEAEAEGMPEDEASEANVGAETPDAAAPEEDATAEADQPEEDAAEPDNTKLTVSIPREKLTDDALDRLRTIVANKEELFKRALLADALPIEVTEDKVSFPWFTLTGIDGEATAYTQFITALCQMATEQKRVLDKPYDGGNDRFTMRIFMVRLGMKGAEFALARKLMMKYLTGNSGWRYEDSASRPDRNNPHRAAVQHLRKAYPKGSRIELIPMDGVISDGVQVGAHGKLLDVDESGTVYIALDDGSAFGIAFSTESAEESETSVSDEEADAPTEDITVDTDETIAEEDTHDSDDDAATEDESNTPVSDENEPDAEEDDEE